MSFALPWVAFFVVFWSCKGLVGWMDGWCFWSTVKELGRSWWRYGHGNWDILLIGYTFSEIDEDDEICEMLQTCRFFRSCSLNFAWKVRDVGACLVLVLLYFNFTVSPGLTL
jgi:hypothetical protein